MTRLIFNGVRPRQMRASWLVIFFKGLEDLGVRGQMPLGFRVLMLLLLVGAVVTIHGFVARASTLATSCCVYFLQNANTI